MLNCHRKSVPQAPNEQRQSETKKLRTDTGLFTKSRMSLYKTLGTLFLKTIIKQLILYPNVNDG